MAQAPPAVEVARQSSDVLLHPDAEAILMALRCDRPRCSCQRPRGRMTHCPSHPDATPSLKVDTRDGRVLVHCHAGCTQEAVLDALRAKWLWPAGSTSSVPPAPRTWDLLVDVMEFLQHYVVLPSQD